MSYEWPHSMICNGENNEMEPNDNHKLEKYEASCSGGWNTAMLACFFASLSYFLPVLLGSKMVLSAGRGAHGRYDAH